MTQDTVWDAASHCIAWFLALFAAYSTCGTCSLEGWVDFHCNKQTGNKLYCYGQQEKQKQKFLLRWESHTFHFSHLFASLQLHFSNSTPNWNSRRPGIHDYPNPLHFEEQYQFLEAVFIEYLLRWGSSIPISQRQGVLSPAWYQGMDKCASWCTDAQQI